MGKHEKNQKPFKVPDDAKLFAKTSLKKFQKQNDFYVDKDASKKEKKEQKKELKEAYYAYLFDLLPETIPLTVWYGNRDEVKDIAEKIYEKICDPKFIKYLKKIIKDGEEFKNMDMLPTMIYNIYHAAQDAAKRDKENGEDSEYDLSDLLDISSIILKKKMKKLTKKVGITQGMAFDVLSVIPTAYILQKSSLYHMRRFMTVVYEYAKTEEFEFGALVKGVLKNKDKKVDLSAFILFLLLEKKGTISKFNEKQKSMFSAITTWVFDELEKFDKDDIRKILNNYVQARKKDGKIGKDENRRYRLKDVPSEQYPKIAKIVSKMAENEDDQKYL